MHSTELSSDPILSANLYGSGLLDRLLADVVAPVLRSARGRLNEEGCAIWTVRYSRRGEHLKVRIHAPGEARELLADLLAAQAEACFASLGDPPAPRAGRSDAPAIDPEDEAPEDAPDRTWLWTTYRRSPVSLGGEPWLSDDLYAARATACLAAGCELVLAALEVDPAPSRSARQKLLIKALLSGLGALGFAGETQAAAYLRYHRDWLLRFFLDSAEQERQVLERFDDQVRRASGTVESLRRLAGVQWSRQGEAATDGAWPRALVGLATYVRVFAGRDEYQIDPFTGEVAFPPFFKVLHGIANQAGLVPLDEAYVHHLLLAAVEPRVPEPVLAAEERE